MTVWDDRDLANQDHPADAWWIEHDEQHAEQDRESDLHTSEAFAHRSLSLCLPVGDQPPALSSTRAGGPSEGHTDRQTKDYIFQYVECDIPPGITIAQWRARKHNPSGGSQMSNQSHPVAAEALDYFGVRPCGCITAWLSSEHSTKTDVRKFYRDMADSGRAVRMAPLDGPDGLRAQMTFDCPHRDTAA